MLTKTLGSVAEPNDLGPTLDGVVYPKFGCGHPKTADNTYTRRSGRRECRICRRTRSRNYGKTSKRRAYWLEYSRLYKHGITTAQYQELFTKQNGLCAGCGSAPQAKKNKYGDHQPKLEVDHNHGCCNGSISCGKCVRGLLCHSCNSALGNAKDSIERLQGLITYLSR